MLSELAWESKGHWGYPAAWLEQWRADLTLTAAYVRVHLVHVARQGSVASGFYALQNDGSRAHLDHFWVRPRFIGQGVGRDLFRHAVAEAARLGLSRLRIEADPNAEPFYARMGARRTGEVHGEVLGHPRVLPVLEYEVVRRTL